MWIFASRKINDQLYRVQFKGKRVLVAPLDWGLGHATRCIPLIEDLLKDRAEVVLGCTTVTRPILQEVFPNLEQCTLLDHRIRYSAGENQTGKLLFQIPKLWNVIRKERQLVSQICKELKIDVIISDNRVGCRAEGVHNIFMTHQVYLKAPRSEQFLQKRFHGFIEQFDELWIPDTEAAPGSAGELSHGTPLNLKTSYIGPLSRFEKQVPVIEKNTLIAVLSGPEPQRSIFESILLEQMEKADLKCTIVRGLPGGGPHMEFKNVEVINHLPTEQLACRMQQAEFIICRSGYSTIMDLKALGRSAILVPTPGQTEQEYLASIQNEEVSRVAVRQNDFDLRRILHQMKHQGTDRKAFVEPCVPPIGSFQSNNLQTVHPD